MPINNVDIVWYFKNVNTKLLLNLDQINSASYEHKCTKIDVGALAIVFILVVQEFNKEQRQK